MVDLIGTSEEGSGAIRKLRTLMLAVHKDSLLKRALSSVRKPDISMPMIEIDRVKAMDGDIDPTGQRSIFGQIYAKLGRRAKEGDIFRGAERWWKVNFAQEHVTDAGGGFRETVSNIAEDLNSNRTPVSPPRDCCVHSTTAVADMLLLRCSSSSRLPTRIQKKETSVTLGCRILHVLTTNASSLWGA